MIWGDSHYFQKHPYVPASILIVTLPSFLGAKFKEPRRQKVGRENHGKHLREATGEFGDVFFFALEDGIPGEAPVVNDP